MDYESVHGRDVTNFSSSQHRLPTVSAAQALQALRNGGGQDKLVQTGIEGLDSELGGGVRRGVLNEVWGPAMVGKGELGLKMARSATRKGESVVWIDCSLPIPAPRLSSLSLPYSQHPDSPNPAEPQNSRPLSLFHHYTAPTLSHLTTLLQLSAVHSLVPSTTTLLILAHPSLSLDEAYPEEEAPNTVTGAGSHGHDEVPASARKESKNLYYDAVQSLLTSLHRVAASRNIAVVILNQATLKEGMLEAPIQVPAWDTGVQNRVVLWRENDGRKGRVVRRGGVVMKGAVVSVD